MIKVQVNTSNDIANKDALERWASDYLSEQLRRFTQDLTSIEVQLSDENAGKGGGLDKRCMMEARVNGRSPLAVTHYGPNQDLAFRGAAEKLAKALDSEFGRLDRREHRLRDTIRRDPDVLDTLSEAPPQT
jgi:hypothetical protein